MYGVRPFVMAKAVACYLSGHARSAFAVGVDDGSLREAEQLVEAMHSAQGYLGDGSWGYEFDVQTRWAFYAAGTPNIIATVFAAHALFEAGSVFGRDSWIDEGVKAAHWAQTHLFRELPGTDAPVFRYTQDTDRLIHNANLLGAGLVAIAAGFSGDKTLAAAAATAAAVSVAAQEPSGRWPYGTGEGVGWSDSFHTAYNLAGLMQVAPMAPELVDAAIDKGARYWMERFFGADGAPHYFDGRKYPLDVHCGATAVDTLARLELVGTDVTGMTDRCAAWMRGNLVDGEGRTYYQKHMWWTDRRRFVRWGDAHWAAALGTVALRDTHCKYPAWSGRTKV
jgi:hypothetical protein